MISELTWRGFHFTRLTRCSSAKVFHYYARNSQRSNRSIKLYVISKQLGIAVQWLTQVECFLNMISIIWSCQVTCYILMFTYQNCYTSQSWRASSKCTLQCDLEHVCIHMWHCCYHLYICGVCVQRKSVKSSHKQCMAKAIWLTNVPIICRNITHSIWYSDTERVNLIM